MRVVFDVAREDLLLAAGVALARVGGEAGVLDERGAGHDLEDARGRGCGLGAEIALVAVLDVARVREELPRRDFDEDHRRLREMVRGEDAVCRSLKLGVQRETRHAMLCRGSRRAVVPDRDLRRGRSP